MSVVSPCVFGTNLSSLPLKQRRKYQRACAKKAWRRNFDSSKNPTYLQPKPTLPQTTLAVKSIMEMADDAASLGYLEFRVLFLNNDDLVTPIAQTLEEDGGYGVRYRDDIIGCSPVYYIRDNLWLKEQLPSEWEAINILAIKIH